MNTVFTVIARSDSKTKATVLLKVVDERGEKVENLELSLSKIQVDSLYDLMFDLSRSMRDGGRMKTFNRNIA